MNIYYECIPCFINQVLRFMKHEGEKNKDLDEKILREVMHTLGDIDYSISPPEMTRKIFNIVERYYGSKDIYINEKVDSNNYIMGMYSKLKNIINNSQDPFDSAMRLAITGNIIDFGANPEFMNEKIHEDIEIALNDPSISSDLLKEEVRKSKKILYIGDNAGEIVFDKLFIEQLPLEKVIFSVRGSFILNDALVEDALNVGMDKLVPVIENGSNYPGTVLSDCTNDFVKVFYDSDLVICKGQGNYETLSNIDHNIIFMLRIKCPVVSRDLNYPIGGHYIGKRKL